MLMILISCRPKYYSLSESDREKIKINSISDSITNENNFYSIRDKDMLNLINRTDTLLIVFFTTWCTSSKDILPMIINSAKKREIPLFLITPDDVSYKEKYIKEIEYTGSIYFLDIELYKSWNIHKNMKKFMFQLYPTIKNVEGFPSGLFIINNNVIFSGIIDADSIKEFMDI